MTSRTNARLAGTAYLLYIAAGIGQMVLFNRATDGASRIPDQLASIARHAPLMGVNVILSLVMAVCAVTLGVTLWALTRDEDRDIAMMGMVCRVVEGAVNAVSVSETLSLMALASASVAAAGGPDAGTFNVLGAQMLRGGGAGGSGAFLFGLGSLCFCWLFVRSRSIPPWLAWTGLVASALWVIGMPLQLGGFLGGPATYLMWVSMAVFEITVAVWLIVKGVATPARQVARDSA